MRGVTPTVGRAALFALPLILISQMLVPHSAAALTTDLFVSEKPDAGSLRLFAKGVAADIVVDTNDWAGVVRVAADLRTDIARVSGITPKLTHDPGQLGKNVVLIGTIGKSALIDRLVKDKKLDVTAVVGKWEAALVQVVRRPMAGVESALVIAGSDKRGTIYGVYALSEQIGVSPWHFWADVPAKHHEALYVKPGAHVLGSPAVKYRGIFLNDEAPALAGWAREKYGGLNHGCYTNIFELLLRLKGNYLWPAMWDNSFATDDPLNAKLADEYGIVMSTSHHEPMMRAWKEWERAGNRKGSWDYAKNEEKLRAFWRTGLERTKYYEKVITLGMRGDGDEPMSETESVALLERIVADQRKMIGETIDPNITEVPQVWALYKEVQGYYERGMRVPDDVTLLWCDDNWGNLRRLPTAAERKRSGGAGIYYHFDYVGGPRNYKWLNTVPITKVWEQMNLAYHHDANRIWIVNVGDLKPVEFPIEFFLTFAWNPERWTQNDLGKFTQLWAEREFGAEHAAAIADIMAKYTKYNGRRKPELLEPGTFSVENYGEDDRIESEWVAITKSAEAIYQKLAPESRDAFYQMVVHPTKASAIVNRLYLAVARNRYYAKLGDGRANQFAKEARELFKEDAELSEYFNKHLAGGKWNHMMDQTHIGYTNWQQPPRNVMPDVIEVTNAIAGEDKRPRVSVPAPKPDVVLPDKWKGFVEANGYVAIEAEHFTRKTGANGIDWEVLPDHGRTLSAVTPLPVTEVSMVPPKNSPCLEYQLWLTTTGRVEVVSFLSPCLNYAPERGVSIAVSFDNEPPPTLTVVPKGYVAGDGNRDWEESVRNNIRTVKSAHTITTPGAHVLKFWMVDPAVVLQRLVVNTGGVKASYLGPPESFSTGIGK